MLLVAGIISSFAAAGSVMFGVYQYRQTVQMSTYRTYADKYNSLLKVDDYDKWLAALSGKDEYWAELTPTMIAYLNLVWEEVYLTQSGIISKKLWRIWRPEVIRTIDTG